MQSNFILRQKRKILKLARLLQKIKMAERGMPMFNFVARQNEKKTVSLTVPRIPDAGSVLVSLKDITDYRLQIGSHRS